MPALAPRANYFCWRRAVRIRIPRRNRRKRGGGGERRGRRRGRLGKHALLPAQHGHHAELAGAAHGLVCRPVRLLVLDSAVAHQPAPTAHGRVRLAAHGAAKARARVLKGASARARGGLHRRQRSGWRNWRQGLFGQRRQH